MAYACSKTVPGIGTVHVWISFHAGYKPNYLTLLDLHRKTVPRNWWNAKFYEASGQTQKSRSGACSQPLEWHYSFRSFMRGGKNTDTGYRQQLQQPYYFYFPRRLDSVQDRKAFLSSYCKLHNFLNAMKLALERDTLSLDKALKIMLQNWSTTLSPSRNVFPKLFNVMVTVMWKEVTTSKSAERRMRFSSAPEAGRLRNCSL